MMSTDNADLGAALMRLVRTIEARKGASADQSYTASLLASGAAKCAKKFGEEATETVIAAASGDAKALTHEAADALYHLLVLLAAAGVPASAVASELARREGVSGHEEKAGRKQ